MTMLPGLLLGLSAVGYGVCALIHPSPRFKVVWFTLAMMFASLSMLHFGMAAARRQPSTPPPAEAPCRATTAPPVTR